MAEKFVFSTKHLGEEYAFYIKHRLPESSEVLKKLRDDFFSEDTFAKDLFSQLGITPDQMKEQLLSKCKNKILKDKLSKLNNWRQIVVAPGMCYAFLDIIEKNENKLKPKIKEIIGCSYFYTVDDSMSDLYAVHCSWKPQKDWIVALVKDTNLISPISGKENTLYLLLHDKDVPGYDGQVFLTLTPEQLDKLEIKGGEKKGDGWYYNGWRVKVLVFNHVSNAAVELLKKNKRTANDIIVGIKSIFDYKNKIEQLFNPKLPPNEKKDAFKNLPSKSILDLCNLTIPIEKNGAIPKEFLSPCPLHDGKKNYYEYLDNGALLTELMHVKTDIRASKQFCTLVSMLRKPGLEKSEMNIKKMCFPLIIRIYKSFFVDWAHEKEKKDQKNILEHDNNLAIDDNLNRVFSFFNNSSIWVRLVDINDGIAYKRAVAEFNYFNNLGLYDYPSALENLEYNTRVFSDNYLVSFLGGHGCYVNPVLYGNETGALKILANERNSLGTDDVPNLGEEDDGKQNVRLWDRIKCCFSKNRLV